MNAPRTLRAACLVAVLAMSAAAPAQARDRAHVTISGNRITITGKVKMPIRKPPVSIMILDSHGETAGQLGRCDATPDGRGRMPWLIHTTRKMAPPGHYSALFIWVRAGKPVERKQGFTIPKP
jgi:hypothetical protein